MISTVWHTGTHSLMEMLTPGLERGRDWEQIHCSPEIVAQADEYDLHTTVRDPLEVAISWANRGRMKMRDFQLERTWFRQWESWAQIAPRATVHQMADLDRRISSKQDDLGLYKALSCFDWGYYYEHIPRETVEFALECVKPYLAEPGCLHGVNRG